MDQRRRRLLTWVAVAAGAALIAALATGILSKKSAPLGAQGPTSTVPTVVETGPAPGAAQSFHVADWGMYNGTADGIRHSLLTQIDKSNVANLGRVFSIDFRQLDRTIPKGQQTFPLAINGVLYATTSEDHVFAIDGASGRVLWHFRPSGAGIFRNYGVTANRGVAYCAGLLFLLTLDMRIVAIDPRNGHQIAQVQISDVVHDAKTEFGYSETMAPICYHDIVLVGAAGSDNGVRGFYMGYRPDLSPAWANPYWTIPPDGTSWRSRGRFHGGGTAWNPASIDPQTNTAYITTSNPSPIYYPALRPGPDPRTDSLIALDVFTGKQRWWRQQLAGDQWGYSTSQPALVYDGLINGRKRRIVSVATKEGVWFAYDAHTGEPIYQGVKLLNQIEHPPLKPGKPVTIFPSSLGGLNYSPSSYDPTTNFVINSQAETAAVLVQKATETKLDASRTKGDVDLGVANGNFGTTLPGWHDYGAISAINVNDGTLAWKDVTPEPGRGGVTTTASGLGFSGGGDGGLRAFDTQTGNVLWSFQTGAQIADGPTIYQAGGKEYLAIGVGGTPTSSFGGTATRLDVFALGGSRTQAPAPAIKAQGPPPGIASAPGMFYSAARTPHTLNLLLIASYAAPQGAQEIDGFGNGGMTVTVPQGWQLHVTFRNDAASQRDGVALAGLSGASSGVVGPGQTSYFQFTAARAGAFRLASTVAGRPAEWIAFNVGAAGIAPTLNLGGATFAINLNATH